MKLRTFLLSIALLTLVGCDKVEKTYMTGTLERDRVEVSVESNEPIIAIHVEDGQIRKTGDLILVYDPARLHNLLRDRAPALDVKGHPRVEQEVATPLADRLSTRAHPR